MQWLLRSFVAALVVILVVFLFLVGQNAQKSDDVIDQHEQFQTEPVFTEDEFISEPADVIASERVADKTVRSIDVIAQGEETRMDELADDQASALIELAFNGVCWVDLTDAMGQRVYRDLAKKRIKVSIFCKDARRVAIGRCSTSRCVFKWSAFCYSKLSR